MTEPPAKRGYPPIGSSLFAGSWIDSSYSIDLIPSLASLGGEEAILNCGLQHDHEPDAFTASLALTVSWGNIRDRDAAKEWMRNAVQLLSDEELMAFNDVVLGSSVALPDLAGTLADAWRSVSDDDSVLRGNVALEGWTRLAAGGWTAGISLRAALFERAQRVASSTAEVDIFLVRAIGAALDQWEDQELESALEMLASQEVVECDVAFELGMADLRRAVKATAPGIAVNALNSANQRFSHACLEGGRPDALAFATACSAVATFLEGGAVDAETVDTIDSTAREWLMGYLNEAPHWRQPRVETGAAWALLVRNLHALCDLDETAWFEPQRLLADVGHLYSAHNSSSLLANLDVLYADSSIRTAQQRAPTDYSPIPVSLGPRVDSSLARDRQRVYLLERWLEEATARLSALEKPSPEEGAAVDAMRAAQRRIQDGVGPPGKRLASREDDGLDPELREALISLGDQAAYDRLVALFASPDHSGSMHWPKHGPVGRRYTPLDEQLVCKRLLHELSLLLPDEFVDWQQHLLLFLSVLIPTVKETIDHGQGGDRRYPWHKLKDSGSMPESMLADLLAWSIRLFTGLHTFVEIPNIAGGRADVVTVLGTERFVIEVKRTITHLADDAAIDGFADQAGQYTLTGPPFAFLAILDLTHWPSRISTDASFWVRPWQVPTTGEIRALTAMRVLADVSTPSELSR